MRASSKPPIPLGSLLNPLPPEERLTLATMLSLVQNKPRELEIHKAIQRMEDLIGQVEVGYPLRAVDESRTPQMKAWRKTFQKLLEWMANPKVGEERLAIALAYCRDGVGGVYHTSLDNQTPLEDLQESRRQLQLLLESEASKLTTTTEERYV